MPSIPIPSQSNDPKTVWGVVGENSWLPLSLRDDGDGVFRKVKQGIEYILTPGSPLPIPLWRKLGEDKNEYEMDLGDGFAYTPTLPNHSTLDELAGHLRQIGQEALGDPESLANGHPTLDKLDDVADELLRVVQQLHDAGYGLAGLDPRSVLCLAPPNGSREHDVGDGNGSTGRPKIRLVLPDLGFVWFKGPLPDWLKDDSRFGFLWDAKPQLMNERAFDWRIHREWARRIADAKEKEKAGSVGLDRQGDLRTLARTFAWVLTAEKHRTIPTRDAARDTKAEAWNVLNRVMKSEITTAEDFRVELASKKLSQHFIEAKPAVIGGDGTWISRWKQVAAALGLLAVAGIGIYLLQIIGPHPPPIHHYCVDCPEFFETLQSFENSEKNGDFPKELEALDELYQARPGTPSASQVEHERACQRKINELARSTLENRAKDLWPELQGMPKEEGRERFNSEIKLIFDKVFILENKRPPTSKEYPEWITRRAGDLSQ